MHYNQLNEFMNCKKSVTENIVPGMGATLYCGSDRYPMVVLEVVSPKHIRVAHVFREHEDKFIENDGIEMLPEELLSKYEYMKHADKFSSSYAHALDYTYRKNYRWMPQGSDMWGTCSIHVGKTDSYLDPCF